MTWEEAKLYYPGIADEIHIDFASNRRKGKNSKQLSKSVITFDTETSQYSDIPY